MASQVKQSVNNIYETLIFTIPISTAISNAVALYGTTSCKLIVPAGMQGTDITFVGSDDGTNFFPLFEMNGSEITVIHTTATVMVALDPQLLYGIKHLKIVAGANQSAGRTLKIIPFNVN